MVYRVSSLVLGKKMADGYLNFDTKIDETDFENTIKSMSSSTKGLKGVLKTLSGYMEKLFTIDTSESTAEIDKETSAVKRDTEATKQNAKAKDDMAKMSRSASATASTATDGMSSKMMSLNEQLRKAEVELENAIKKKEEFASSSQIPTEEYAKATQEADNLERNLEKLIEQKNNYIDWGGDTSYTFFKDLENNISKVESELKNAKSKVSELNKEGKAFTFDSNTPEFGKLSSGVANAQGKVNILKQRITELSVKESEAGKSTGKATSLLNKMSNATQKLSGKMLGATKNAGTMGNTLAKKINPVPKLISGVSGKVDKLGKKLGGMVKKVFVFSMLTKALRTLRSAFQSVITSDDDMAKSLSQIKGNLLTAFAPLYAFVLPGIKAVLSALVTFSNYMANVMSAVFGKTIAQSSALAKQLYDSTKATDENTKATKKNAKAKKDQVASYDELNIMQQDSSDEDSSTAGAPVFDTKEVGTGWVDDIKKLINSGDWEGVGTYVANKLNSALKSIKWADIQKSAQDIASKLARTLNGFFSVMDLADTLGNTVAQALNTGLTFAYTFLTTFDFNKFGTFIGTSINSFIANFNWTLLGNTIGSAVQGAIDMAYGFVTTYNWGSFASGIATTINNFFSSIDWSKAGQTVGKAIIGIFNEISTFLQQVDWEAIGKDVGQFLSNIDWNKIIKDLFGIISDAVKSAFGLVKGSLEGLTDDGLDPIEAAFIGLGATISGIKLTKFISNIADMTKNLILNTAAIWKNVAAWVADKAETLAVYALLLKDIVQRGLQTAAMAAQTAGTWLLNAAQTALNLVMSMNPISLIIIAITALIAAFVLLWNKCEWFRNFWIGLWKVIQSAAKTAWSTIKGFFVGAWNAIKSVWSMAVTFFKVIWSAIKIVFEPVVTYFRTIFKNALDAIISVFSTIKGFFTGIIGGIKNIFSGLIDFITGVFTGDWRKAWNGVKKIFKGVWDTFYTIVKTPINLIIDGINLLWKGIYAAVKGIVDSIGNVAGALGDIFGKDWHFKMPSEPPTIPKLARGAVIPPRAPFMAVLGDQKKGTNIEAPLETIKQALRDVQSENGGTLGGSDDNIVVNVYLEGDADGVFNLVKTEAKKYKNRTGNTAFA